MKLRLDLHTHCHEATALRPPTAEVVETILEAMRGQGLDGIAITEHYDKDYAYKVKDIVERFFNNEVIIIPGREIGTRVGHEVELYLPNNTIFRFLAHPGYPPPPGWLLEFPDQATLDNIQGIEIKNWMNGFFIDEERVRQVAERHDLLLLRNSDAHYLYDIGKYYNEFDLEELYVRARPIDVT